MNDDDQDDNIQSTDDAMEDTRDNQDPTSVGQNKLPEDNDSPAAPADDPGVVPLPQDHPLKDSDIDSTEAYQEGEQGE